MKDKILNILLLSLTFLLVFQYFGNSKNPSSPTSGGIEITPTKTAYTIPAHVALKIQNNTGSGITLAPCQDIKINFNGKYLQYTHLKCDSIVIEPTKFQLVDFSGEYTNLLEKGRYIFEVHTQDKNIIVPIDLENRGALGKLFVYLFYAPIYNLMVFLLYFFGNSLGWAIIAITIIIRLLLLYPQHQMMLSQKKLQAIQPKIKALQDQLKGDSQKLGVELMNLYKKEKVNPMGSCGLLIIQLPILLVIYNVITSILDSTNSYYLYSFFSHFQVSQIVTDFYGINLLGVGGLHGAILALFVGGVQFIQVSLSMSNMKKSGSQKGLVLEKKPGDEGYNSLMPDPEFMNKFMMYGMPAMVVVFTYSLFIGIGMYWGVSTVFAIFQQLLVNKILKK